MAKQYVFRATEKDRLYHSHQDCCHVVATILEFEPPLVEGDAVHPLADIPILGGYFDELFNLEVGKRYRIRVEEIDGG